MSHRLRKDRGLFIAAKVGMLKIRFSPTDAIRFEFVVTELSGESRRVEMPHMKFLKMG